VQLDHMGVLRENNSVSQIAAMFAIEKDYTADFREF